MNDMHWPALVTLATLALGFATAWIVGNARVRYGIRAPATAGHEMFDRAYRVQMNTLETTVLFLPALWLCAWYFSAAIAAAIGTVWVVARLWYAVAYLREPKSRGTAFGLAYAAWGALMLAAAWGVLRALLAA